MAETDMSQIKSIAGGEQYISLTTYRKNGNEIATPVWFAQDDEGKLYVMTLNDAWKVKRIRNNSHVKLAPCNARGVIHGDTIKGMATIHEANSPTAQKAEQLLTKKYGIMKRLFGLLRLVQRKENVYLEITPQ